MQFRSRTFPPTLLPESLGSHGSITEDSTPRVPRLRPSVYATKYWRRRVVWRLNVTCIESKFVTPRKSYRVIPFSELNFRNDARLSLTLATATRLTGIERS